MNIIKKKYEAEILVLFIFYISVQIARGFLPIAQETHFLATKIYDYIELVDEATYIYSYLRTPIYPIIVDWVFANQYFFFIFSYFFPLFIILSIYLLFLKITKSSIYSFFVASLFIAIPLFIKLLMILGVDNAYEKITILYPRIDIWYRTFSVRQIHGIIFIISLIFLYEKNYKILIILTVLNLFAHPNSGIITSGIIFIFLFFELLQSSEKEKIIKYISILAFSVVCFAFVKLLSIKEFIEFKNTNHYWYSNLIKDESDDFSVIYRFKNNFLIFITFLATFFYSIFIYRNNQTNISVRLILSILMLYFSFFIIEILIYYFNINFFTPIILSLQPGWKTIGYIIFPVFIYFFYNICLKFNFSLKNYKSIIFILYISCSVLLIFYGSKKNYKNIIYYFSNLKSSNVSYYDYLKLNFWKIDLAREIYNIDNSKINERVKFDYRYALDKSSFIGVNKNEIDFSISFFKKYNSRECLSELNEINEIIPDYSGVIIPPYFLQFRDFFAKKNIYYQEHHDGNLSMGNKNFFNVFNYRMKSLLGVDYLKLPSKITPYQPTYIRNIYINLKYRDFKKIKQTDNNYKFIITEDTHNLTESLQLKKGNCFHLYEIK